MKLTKMVPPFVKTLLRPVKKAYQRLTSPHRTRDELHHYWRQPPDPGNLPEDYLEGAARSAWLVQLVEQHLSADQAAVRILEVGCNVGRNLNHLFTAGYRNLAGVEINENAIRVLRQRFPDLAASAQIHVGPVEDKIRTFSDAQFDLVYSMAVLEHIHEDSAWVFGEMARITKRLLITIEDEREFSERHFPRNYGRIFTGLGLKQVQSLNCDQIEGLGAGFLARIFLKEPTSAQRR